MNGEYQLDQLLLARKHFEQKLEAFLGYDAWRQARYAGDGPPGATLIIAQKSKVEALIAKARAKTATPLPIPPQ